MSKNSIIKKIVIVLVIPIFLQAFLFVLMIFNTGVMSILEEGAVSHFKDRESSKYDYMQEQMIQNRRNINRGAKNINSFILHDLEEKGLSINELNINEDVSDEIVVAISGWIMGLARENYTTDTFVIFDTKEDHVGESSFVEKEGIYIKDTDPVFILEDNSDLYIERGTIQLANRLKININSNWKKKYLLNKEDSNNDFFYKPMNEARKRKNREGEHLGYWSKPCIITNENLKVITYTVPLINNEGIPYGVLGIGIDSNYINRIFKENRLNEVDGYEIIVEDKDIFRSNINVGSIDEKLINYYKNTDIQVDKVIENIYRLTSKADKRREDYAFRKELHLYEDSDFFADEKWYALGLIKSDELFYYKYELIDYLKVSMMTSTLIGLISALMYMGSITKPIRGLAEKVRQSNPREPLKLEKINISEIDDLSLAITNLSKNIAYESSQLDKIINILNMPLGAFKHTKGDKHVYCTNRFFHILGIEGVHEEAKYVDLDSFNLIMEEATKHRYENEENVYIIKKENQEDRWIKLITQEEEVGRFGVITDITQNILEKRKIEYDRDHDSLTKLLNRRAFRKIALDKISHDNISIAAVIMWDLDNLKFINDTYGHEAGDEYIRQAANILREFEKYNALVARVSGDEFLVFMYGHKSKSDIMGRVKEIQNNMKNTIFDFPYYHYNKIKIRASVGIAWYPEDADNLKDLIKYADFAMYKIKNTVKGSIAEFCRDEYNEKSFLINNKEDLNRLIDEKLVYYVFHPIVDVRTGQIYGYELLMRSKLESLKSPYQVLAIAAAESKLHEIEKLTWFKGLETVEGYDERLGDARIFINSIPNYMLSEEDFDQLLSQYGKYFRRLVVELLENERSDSNCILEKKRRIERFNAKIAIDDFGSGYNNEAVLLEVNPDLIKVDMEIVREIHNDLDRQDIIKNLISYTTKRGIKVIAEGVETREELEKLIQLGVDYVQGYYISKPEDHPSELREDLIQEILNLNKNKF